MHAEQAYLFHHALLRDAAYQLQLPGDRARLHGLALEIIEEFYSDPKDTTALDMFIFELAEHARRAWVSEANKPAELLRKEWSYLSRAADLARLGFELPAAIQYYQRMLAHPSATPVSLIETRLKLATVFRVQGSRSDAEAHGQSAVSSAQEAGQPLLEARAKGMLANVLQDTGRYEEAKLLFGEALRIARNEKSVEVEASALQSLGGAEMMLHDLDSAERRFESARSKYEEANLLGALCGLLTDQCLLLQYRGKLDAAAAKLEEAIAFCARVGNERQKATAMSSLGDLRVVGDRLEEAEPYLQQALLIHRRLGDRRSEGIDLTSIGKLRHGQGRLREAEDAFVSARQLMEETDNPVTKASLLEEMASLFQEQGEIKRALRYLDKCIELAIPMKLNRLAGFAQVRKAMLHMLTGEYSLAAGALEVARSLLAEFDPEYAGWLDEAAFRLELAKMQFQHVTGDAPYDVSLVMPQFLRARRSCQAGAKSDRQRFARLAKEIDAALRYRRPPELFFGHLPAELQPRLRAALLDHWRANHRSVFRALRAQSSLCQAMQSGGEIEDA